MEQQAKSNEIQKPSQETKPAKAQATLVEPTLTPSSEARGHAGEKFEMGTGSVDSFSVDFQESALMLRDENPAETRDAAIVADSLLLRKESTSLPRPEDRLLQNREAMVEETPGIE